MDTHATLVFRLIFRFERIHNSTFRIRTRFHLSTFNLTIPLQLYCKLLQSGIEHLIGDDGLHGIGHGIDESLAHIILADDE